MHIIAKADFWVFLLDKEKSRTKVAYCKKVFFVYLQIFWVRTKVGSELFSALMSFDGPVGSINRHEIKGPSKDMRFLGPSKDMRF